MDQHIEKYCKAAKAAGAMATGASCVLKQKLEKGSGATSSAGKLITNQPLGHENAHGEQNCNMPKLR